MVILLMEYPNAYGPQLLPVVSTTALDAERTRFESACYDNDVDFPLPKILSVTSLSDTLIETTDQIPKDQCCKRKSVPSSSRLCIKHCKIESKRSLELDILSPSTTIDQAEHSIESVSRRTIHFENGKVSNNVQVFYPAWSCSNRWKIQKSLMQNVVRIMDNKPLPVSELPPELKKSDKQQSSEGNDNLSDISENPSNTTTDLKFSTNTVSDSISGKDMVNDNVKNNSTELDAAEVHGDKPVDHVAYQDASIVKFEPEQLDGSFFLRPDDSIHSTTNNSLSMLHADHDMQQNHICDKDNEKLRSTPNKKLVKESAPKKRSSPRKSARTNKTKNNMSKIDKLREMLRQKEKDLEEMRRGYALLK